MWLLLQVHCFVITAHRALHVFQIAEGFSQGCFLTSLKAAPWTLLCAAVHPRTTRWTCGDRVLSMIHLPHHLECLPQTCLKHLASLNEVSDTPLISFKGNLVYNNK